MKNKANRFLKVTALSLAMSSMLVSGFAVSAMQEAESSATPTIKGWRPYLPSVGARYVGTDRSQRVTGPKVGDVIEIPTNFGRPADPANPTDTERLYIYKDGNGTQDTDADITNRVRADHAQRENQKVRVQWFTVTAKPGKKFADEIPGTDLTVTPAVLPADWESNTTDYVKTWDDVNAVAITDADSLIFLSQNNKSLALTVPAEAAGSRVGFIVQAESQTGDPFRGDELKAPDLNFFWSQTEPTGPGDCDPDTEDCDNTTEPPTDPNPEGPGGPVKESDYIVTIRHLTDKLGGVKDKTVDAVVGSSAHPFPVVDEIYYAEIKVITAEAKLRLTDADTTNDTLSSADYRELTSQAELDSVTWELSATGFNLGAEDPAAPREGPLSISWAQAKDVNGAGEGDDRLSDPFTLKLQLDNADALNYWGATAINQMTEKSEQRASIKVKFSYDDSL